MSTILNTNGTELRIPAIESELGLFHIVTAEWNPDVTHALRDGAVRTLAEGGVGEGRLRMHSVPGTVELVYAAARLLRQPETAAVIVIGCVIRGDTPHFDYVCQQAAVGIAELNAKGTAPVIFGVLTVNELQQALDRAGGSLGNKGSEAAVAAIEMVNFASRNQ
ncbi:MAG: 6,7-dimethyl-8-ribityllumazine synthase [Bacteroides sp.]|nr:6,7-dimethyl-8-ribityllumazine synthase [Bacteroides sp.]MBD5307427.1 6,7-dimethyl-8-ribityllumazine synthase [Bacteroides sp.]